VKFTLEIHRSLRNPEDPSHLNLEIINTQKTYMQIISEMLEELPNIKSEVVLNNRPKPGILYIANQSELNSLGILNQKVDVSEDIEIKIVPILHGG
jgi:hypothetical protein